MNAKAKLEELKRRKMQLQKQMEERKRGIAAQAQGKNQADSFSQFNSASGEEKKEFTRKSNLTTAFQLKRRNEALRSSSFSATLIGIYPQLSENSSQYELPKEFQKLKEEEEKAKEAERKLKLAADNAAANFARRFTKKINLEEIKNLEQPEEQKFLNEANANELLNKNQIELDSILNNAKNIFEDVSFYFLFIYSFRL